MPNTQRCFIAFKAADPWLLELEALQATLANAAPEARLVPSGQLHITLRFLGRLSPRQINAAANGISEAAKSFAPLEVALGNAGTFGQPPRVLWLGIARGQADLKALAVSLDAALYSAGFGGREQPFHPHLTLARARSDRCSARLLDLPGTLRPIKADASRLDELILFASEPSASGSQHHPVFRTMLQAPDGQHA